MDLQYHIDQEYNGVDFSQQSPLHSEFESCVFRNCHLAEADLSECRFIDCTFSGCHLSNARIINSSFNDVEFRDCKMLGLAFETCKQMAFSASFSLCQLNHSTFFEMDLTRCAFKNCQLEGVDFGRANLEGVTLRECDLREAMFEATNLQGADLTRSVHFLIDPEQNKIRGARFSLSQMAQLLTKYDLVIDPDS